MKTAKRSVSLLLAFLLIFSAVLSDQVKVSASKNVGTTKTVETTEEEAVKTASQKYVEAMAPGWNLGNSLDAYDENKIGADIRETSWGNPIVVKELIENVKNSGFNSIRIPITFEGCVEKTGDTYVVDEAWLTRIKEVVDMALDLDLYVMINVHHDSWIWLSAWDGNTQSEEYIKFCAIWTQFAAYFKDYGEKLCFETINEPQFNDNEGENALTADDKLDIINKAAYDIIRSSGGNNDTRMIVLPTYNTNHEKDVQLYNLITNDLKVQDEQGNTIQDPNVIATIHYYSEWVFSANLGITGFDEKLWDDDQYEFDYTARTALNIAFDRIYNQFTANGIGVVIGEYGILPADSALQCMQVGEEIKYYEYINTYARNKGITLMFWDNGDWLSREDNGQTWKNPTIGEAITASIKEDSSYATGLNTIYLKKLSSADTDTGLYYSTEPIDIPLTLNGNTLSSIKDESKTLVLGEDYTYNEESATVTLSSSYVASVAASTAEEAYGQCAVLTFEFSGGANWYEYIVKCTDIELGDLEQVQKPEYTDDTYDSLTKSEKADTKTAVKIHTNFNGNDIRRAVSYTVAGKTGPNLDWWNYLQYGETYYPEYEDGYIRIFDSFFNNASVPTEGKIVFKFELYNGDTVAYAIERNGDQFTKAKVVYNQNAELPANILVYAGEKEIPEVYLKDIIDTEDDYMFYWGWGTSEGAISVDWDNTVEYWLHPFTVSETAQEAGASFGGRLSQYATEIFYDTTIWVKDAPIIKDTVLYDYESASIQIENLLPEGEPSVSYEVEDPAIATVSNSGKVTPVSIGSTKVNVTVTQYGRTDTFTGNIVVKGSTYVEDTSYTFHVGDSDSFSISNLGYGTYTVVNSNPEVVKVEGMKITAIAVGTASLTVYCKVDGVSYKYEIDITVKADPSITVADHALFTGDSEYVEISDLDKSASIKVTSSDETVVSVAGTKLTAQKAGTAVITLDITELDKTYHYSFTVTVNESPSITVSNNLTLYAGEANTFAVTNSETIAVTATSSNEAVATVKDNTITAIAAGVAEITVVVTVDGRTYTNKVKVTVKESKIEFITGATTLKKGKTSTYKVLLTGVTGNVTFTSSDQNVATVDVNSGVVTAKNGGTAVISATYTNGTTTLTTSKTLKVVVPTTSIKVKTTSANKKTIYIKKGSSHTLGIEVKPFDTTDKLTFKSSNTKVATVSSKGKITAKKTGTTKITITSGTKSVTITVKVVAKGNAATKLSVSKKKVSLKKGTSYSITPIVYPTTTTSRVTFKSSNTKVATVDKYGQVTAKKNGKSTITVKAGKKTIKITVTVK